jgi:hypothetical protein
LSPSAKSIPYAWLLAWILWCLLVLGLSLVPHPPNLGLSFLSWDKFQHAGAYALVTLLAGNCLVRWRPQSARAAWGWAAAFALAFGALLEVLQGLTGGRRSSDPMDFLANSLGILSVCALVWLWRRWSGRDRSLNL